MRAARRSCLAALAAVFLAAALVGPAGAKGRIELRLCGASRCVLLAGSPLRPPVRNNLTTAVARGDAAAPTPAPYYVLRVPWEGTAGYWVPSASLLRITSTGFTAAWLHVRPAEAARLRRAVRGVAPCRTERVDVVTVAGIRARDPQSYLALYRVGVRAAPPRGADWEQVWLTGEQSPWTDGQNDLAVATNGPYLRRDGEVLRIPAALARRIRAAAPLPAR